MKNSQKLRSWFCYREKSLTKKLTKTSRFLRILFYDKIIQVVKVDPGVIQVLKKLKL